MRKSKFTDAQIAFVLLQAEDGIRDLVRSRGLGDVYKRQIKWSQKWVSGQSQLNASNPRWKVTQNS